MPESDIFVNTINNIGKLSILSDDISAEQYGAPVALHTALSRTPWLEPHS